MGNEHIINDLIDKLADVFTSNISDFFFTEKELHSYFLKLCYDNGSLMRNGYLTVHSEYPTPFKCSYNNIDIIKLEDDKSSKIRAHIDMVFINTNYIDWIIEKREPSKYISGIEQSSVFEVFNPILNSKYEEFYNIYSEPILDYAIEFKYLRHGYLGSKYPIKDIIQDIEKLRLLREYPKQKYSSNFSFVKNTLSAIFIGERGEYILNNLRDSLSNYDNDEYKIIISGKNA